MSTAVERLDAKIQLLRKQLGKLEAFRESMEDPDLMDVFSDGGEAANGDTKKKKKKKRGGTMFSAVATFFKSRNNEWANSKQIREGSGLTRGAISNLMYHQRKDDFEKNEEVQPILWRMREQK